MLFALFLFSSISQEDLDMKYHLQSQYPYYQTNLPLGNFWIFTSITSFEMLFTNKFNLCDATETVKDFTLVGNLWQEESTNEFPVCYYIVGWY